MKKGQIYLIATVVIIAVVSSLTFLFEYNQQKNSNFVYDLKKQLEIESGEVIDYGLINGENLDSFMEEFAEDFDEYAGRGIEIYFISGNLGSMDAYYFDNGKQNVPETEENESVIFSIEDISYNCKINEGYNFYFVIMQDIGGEKYIENSEGCVGRGIENS